MLSRLFNINEDSDSSVGQYPRGTSSSCL